MYKEDKLDKDEGHQPSFAVKQLERREGSFPFLKALCSGSTWYAVVKCSMHIAGLIISLVPGLRFYGYTLFIHCFL